MKNHEAFNGLPQKSTKSLPTLKLNQCSFNCGVYSYAHSNSNLRKYSAHNHNRLTKADNSHRIIMFSQLDLEIEVIFNTFNQYTPNTCSIHSNGLLSPKPV